MEKKHILIIEDDEFLASLAVTKIQKEDFDVKAVETGEAGLASIKKQKPDLILLDLMLPDISGFDILKEVKEDPSLQDIKVIVFSNLGDDEDIKQGEDLGADEFLVKANFTLDELVEKIKKML